MQHVSNRQLDWVAGIEVLLLLPHQAGHEAVLRARLGDQHAVNIEQWQLAKDQLARRLRLWEAHAEVALAVEDFFSL